MNLYKHQQRILEKSPKRCLLAWSTGTGKSLAGIELLKKNADHKPLIICPKSIKSKWIADVPSNWLVMTKEEFKKQADTLPPHSILVDEAHYFSGIKSQMSKKLIKYINRHNIEVIYLLTATPYMSSVWNLYTLATILKYNINYGTFKRKYFDMIPMGRRMIPVQKKKVNGVPIQEMVAKMVERIGDTVSMQECFDVPEQIFLVEEFSLTSEQKKAIKDIDDVEPIVYWTKCHQICGGTVDGMEYKSDKMQRVLDLAQEHKKIVIVSRYNHERKLIVEKLKKLGLNVFHISSDEQDVNQLAKQAEEATTGVVVASAGISEGYELPSFPIMVFYSYDFSLKNYIQVIGRILRANKLKKNVYISLVTKGTVDEDVYRCIQKKEDFQIEIYKKVN